MKVKFKEKTAIISQASKNVNFILIMKIVSK